MVRFGDVSEQISRCVASVRRRAAEHAPVFERNETATRVQLIDPILRALGWDVEDPRAVKHEYRITSGRLDYALFVRGSLVAILEAKSLSTSFTTLPQGQLMKYARDPECHSLSAVAVTNGIQWVVHRETDQWSLKRIDISQGETFKAAYEAYELLHHSHFTNVAESATQHHSRIAIVPDQSTQYQSPIARPLRPGRPRPRPSTFPDDGPTRNQLPVAHAATLDLTDPAPNVSGKRRPTSFVDHRGVSHQLRSWADLHRTAVNALIDDHKINAADCPIKFSPNRAKCLINDRPYHPNGRRIKKVEALRGGMYLEGDFGAIDIIRNLRVLFQRVHLPLDSIKINFDS